MSTYWQHFDLEFDPFSADQRMTCFISSQWRQLLDLLAHLSVSSQAVMLVTGLSGIGKTTLLRQLTEDIADKVGICKIQGDASIGPEVLYYLLAKHLGLATLDGQKENFKRHLLSQLENMHENNQQYLLVVDDAHLLPERTLAAVLEITALQTRENNPLHVLLFGGPQLEAAVGNIAAQQLTDGATHTSRIKPLNREMTEQYILHRLQVVGYSGEPLFSKAELDQIYHSSSGIPAKINYFAKQLLGLKLPGKANTTTEVSSRYSPRFAIGAGAVLGIFVLGYLGYQTLDQSDLGINNTASSELTVPIAKEVIDDNRVGVNVQMAELDVNAGIPRAQFNDNSRPSANVDEFVSPTSVDDVQPSELTPRDLPDHIAPLSSLPPATEPVISEEPQSMPPPALLQSDVAPSNPTADTVTVDNAKDTTPTLTLPAATTLTTIAPPPVEGSSATNNASLAVTENRLINGQNRSVLPPTSTTTKSPSTPKNVTPAQKSTTKPAATKKASTASVATYTPAEKKLLSSNGRDYTIQLMGSFSKQSLVRLVRATGVESKVTYFKTYHQGKEWHVAIYGQYPNREKAQQALQALPGNVQKQKPWVRSIASVQQSIKMTGASHAAKK